MLSAIYRGKNAGPNDLHSPSTGTLTSRLTSSSSNPKSCKTCHERFHIPTPAPITDTSLLDSYMSTSMIPSCSIVNLDIVAARVRPPIPHPLLENLMSSPRCVLVNHLHNCYTKPDIVLLSISLRIRNVHDCEEKTLLSEESANDGGSFIVGCTIV